MIVFFWKTFTICFKPWRLYIAPKWGPHFYCTWCFPCSLSLGITNLKGWLLAICKSAASSPLHTLWSTYLLILQFLHSDLIISFPHQEKKKNCDWGDEKQEIISTQLLTFFYSYLSILWFSFTIKCPPKPCLLWELSSTVIYELIQRVTLSCSLNHDLDLVGLFVSWVGKSGPDFRWHSCMWTRLKTCRQGNDFTSSALLVL